MIVDRLRTDERGERIERSARLRWDGGEFRLAIAVPAELVPTRPDASPFVCAAVLLAMRLSEDLDVRAPVSAPLLASAPRIVDLYSSWDPRLYRTRVAAEAGHDPVPRATGVGSFLSRGVDSLYSAAVPRGLPGPLTHLVFCDRLEPGHSPPTRAEEMRLAGEAAAALGLPLVVLETNLRELSDPIVGDWEDMAGAGLAMLATALGGGIGHAVIPSSDGPMTIGPCGTSPLLDPLFSTAEVEIVHDTPVTRMNKVRWLARERRDLLPLLKVCFQEDRPDNCGRCSKCVLTMLCLEAVGALGEATGFPSEVDTDCLEPVRPRALNSLLDFGEVERALRDGGATRLADATRAVVERGAATDPGQVVIPERTPDFRKRASRHTRLMMRHGPGPRTPAPERQPARRQPAPPLASVLMPAYEATATLRDAVTSVLEQTIPDFELIVIDDGSSVHLADWLGDLHDPRVRVIRHPRNRGLSRARNTGLAAARAALVAQLDADDMWEPDYLAGVIPRFEDQGVGLVYTNATILGHPTGHDDYIGDPAIHPLDEFPKLAEACPIPSPTATMRTAAVRAVGGYAWWLRQCEDYHLYLKLARAGWRFDYVHRRLARYRWPEPGRGMSYDARRHELWELAMFGSIVARHPRTPGPRRQVRIRARREAERVRAIAGRGLPAPAAASPAAAAHPPVRPARVLVDPGSHAVMNLGDIAMLQVCVERLRRLIPGAAIEVITADPERLARHCPDVAPVPAEGVYPWFDSRWSGGPYSPLLSRRTRDRLVGASRLAGRGGARAARAALRAELLAREPVSDETRAFLASLLAADAVVVSGRGGTADAFRDDALRVLELLRLAAGLGATTALLGQGLGPAEDPELAARAAEVLPRVDLIAVRDRLTSLPLLERAAVAPHRIVVTGDDALAPAHAARAASAAGGGIGVGLRMAGYAEVGEEAYDAVGRALRVAAERHDTELRGIPISLYPHEADADVLEELGAGAGSVEAPADAIARAGASRVVVAGSYHAAVFALAQGVPVVGLASSDYYTAKLNGLADLFPGGCTVVPLAGDGLEERIGAAVDAAWGAAESLRPALLEAAERQIGAAEAAYERLAVTLTGVAPAHAANGSNGAAAGADGTRHSTSISVSAS